MINLDKEYQTKVEYFMKALRHQFFFKNVTQAL